MQLGIIKITYNRTATQFMDNSFVNLGDEVILTFLWQSGTSESATICMLYLLLTVQMQSFVHCVSVCVYVHMSVCVCVHVRERERQGHITAHHLS